MDKNIRRATWNLLFPICLMTPTLVSGQDLTANGYQKNWTGEITVQRDSIRNGKHRLEGHSIPIYEADASKVLALWKAEYKGLCTTISGSDPAKAIDARVPGIGEAPMLVLAKAHSDGKNNSTRLTLAFCANDSINAPAADDPKDALHALAVKLNRAVIQEQIAEQQKVVDKYSGKVEGAQKDQAKAQKKTASANADLEKAKKNKSKLSADQAEQQADVQKYQQRYNTTQDPKDLAKLTKAQQKVIKTQKKMSKELKNEAKAQKDANKQQKDVPDAQKEQEKQQKEKEIATTDLEALKRKLEAVR